MQTNNPWLSADGPTRRAKELSNDIITVVLDWVAGLVVELHRIYEAHRRRRKAEDGILARISKQELVNEIVFACQEWMGRLQPELERMFDAKYREDDIYNKLYRHQSMKTKNASQSAGESSRQAFEDLIDDIIAKGRAEKRAAELQKSFEAKFGNATVKVDLSKSNGNSYVIDVTINIDISNNVVISGQTVKQGHNAFAKNKGDNASPTNTKQSANDPNCTTSASKKRANKEPHRSARKFPLRQRKPGFFK